MFCNLLSSVQEAFPAELWNVFVNLSSILYTGVTRVFFGSDFITVTKSDDTSWDILKPEIFAAVMDFYTSGQPLFLDESTAASKDTAIHEVCVLTFQFLLFFCLVF